MKVIYNDITKCVEYYDVEVYWYSALGEEVIAHQVIPGPVLEPYPESHHLD